MKHVLALLVLCLLLAVTSSAQAVTPDTMTQPIDPASKETGSAHLGLDKLIEEYRSYRTDASANRSDRTLSPFKTKNPMIQVVGETVIVEIVVDDPTEIAPTLQQLGLTNLAVYQRLISGRIPIDSINSIAGLAGVHSVRPAIAMTRTGSVASQGDIAMHSNAARSDLEVDGTGLRIGTLSDSYDDLGGAAADITSGDLPSGITVLADLGGGGTDEGRAMMQIVHDIAPGATQSFHTAFEGQPDFALGIEELAGCPPGSAAGCTPNGPAADIIVDDVFYLAEPMFQDGIIAQAIRTATNAGVAYFAAAGNDARHSYEQGFRGSGIEVADFGGELHDFQAGAGVDAYQSVTIPVGSTIQVVLQWDEPFASVSGAPGSGSDVDLWLFDATGSETLVGSAASNVGSDPVEVFSFSNNGSYGSESFNLGVSLWSGSAPGLFKYIYFGDMTINQHATNDSTVFGHANALEAVAVGAVDYFDAPAFGTSPPIREPFSSAGGTDVLFDTAGSRSLSPRSKPDVMAPDGVDNTFFGTDNEPNGLPNFTGTSAAAPHAAGAAALLLECSVRLTPQGVADLFESTAVEMAGPGFDLDTGWGLIDAHLASSLACAGAFTPDAIGVYRPSNHRSYLDVDGSTDWSGGDVRGNAFGGSGDIPVNGDWNGDGWDQIGIYRPSNHRYYLDADGSLSWTVGDIRSQPFGVDGDLPVTGDWNGDGTDEIGVFRPSSQLFYLDANRSFDWNSGDIRSQPFGNSTDTPITGDWNGDGTDEIGVFRPSSQLFYLDANRSFDWNSGDIRSQPFGNSTDTPITGDWNGDGTDEIGVFRPSSQLFYLDANRSFDWNSGDIRSQPFGNSTDTPITGNWG